jgi:predicted anti-sigma-YlaC factor YlaD
MSFVFYDVSTWKYVEMNFVTSSWVIFPKGEKHWHSLNYWVVQTVESRKSAVAENVCVGVLLLLMFQMLFSF